MVERPGGLVPALGCLSGMGTMVSALNSSGRYLSHAYNINHGTKKRRKKSKQPCSSLSLICLKLINGFEGEQGRILILITELLEECVGCKVIMG